MENATARPVIAAPDMLDDDLADEVNKEVGGAEIASPAPSNDGERQPSPKPEGTGGAGKRAKEKVAAKPTPRAKQAKKSLELPDDVDRLMQMYAMTNGMSVKALIWKALDQYGPLKDFAKKQHRADLFPRERVFREADLLYPDGRRSAARKRDQDDDKQE